MLGGPSDHIAWLVDGIPLVNPFHAGGTFGALNADALAGITLSVAPGTAALADAIGGAFVATTRPPPERTLVAGGLSATQARLMMEAPLGTGSAPERAGEPAAGWLASGRLVFPGLLGQKRDPSHIEGDAADALVRLAIPLGGGMARVIAVQLRSDVSVATRLPGAGGGGAAAERSELQWRSTSVGAVWEATHHSWRPRLMAWGATGGADVTWLPDTVSFRLKSRLSEAGVAAQASTGAGGSGWLVAGRLARRESRYATRRGASGGGAMSLRSGATPVTVHVERRQRLSPESDFAFGSSVHAFRGRVLGGPFAEITWGGPARSAVSLAASRRYQFTQSLRNAESLVGAIFPAELPVVADSVVPVARADQLILSARARSGTWLHVAARAWLRELSGLALPAIGHDEFVGGGDVATGRGRSRGIALDASVAGARFGFLASYALQRARLAGRDTSWAPDYATVHSIETGVAWYPAPSATIRVALSGGAGRRTSAFSGAFEWEACNLLDRGCEFAGGPLRRVGPLGSVALPPYLRLDLGARKHWHVNLGGRDAVLALHATYSNVFDRANVLAYVRDPSTGLRQSIGMRPASPLVVGLDWSF